MSPQANRRRAGALDNDPGILSGIGYGFDGLGDGIHSHFPPALAVKFWVASIFA